MVRDITTEQHEDIFCLVKQKLVSQKVFFSIRWVKGKVKQSPYRRGGAQRVPGS